MKGFFSRHARSLAFGATALSVIGHIIAWMLLPKTLVLQMTSEGTAGNVMPSWLFFTLITVAEAMIWIGTAYQKGNRSKWLMFCGIVLFMDLLTIVLNIVGWQNLI